MSKSKVIRASEDVTKYLRTKKIKKNESWDSVLRRLLGLKDRKGNPQMIENFW